MAEWLYEDGIGESRAALVEAGEILEAAIELPDQLRAGSVNDARLVSVAVPGKRGIVALNAGGEAWIEPLPAGITEGAPLRVEIVREEIPEAGRPKHSKVRATERPLGPGPTLRQRIGASGFDVSDVPLHGPDLLEQAGWSELLEQALSGEIPFPGGALRMSLTPAMTLFDVDGTLAPRALALAGAGAAARAIRRFGIGGSIGIDLPTLPSREDRQAAARMFDAILPQPFERTSVNGFGFLQVVRRRERPSLPEMLRAEPAAAAARALLRLAERAPGRERTLIAAPPVIARIEQKPEWLSALERRTGSPVFLRAEPGLSIWASHVHASPC